MASNKNWQAITLAREIKIKRISLIKFVCHCVAYFKPDSAQTPLWLWREVQNCRMILPVFTWDSTKAFQTKICQHHSNCYKTCDYADIDLSRTNLWWYYIIVLYNSVFVNFYVRIFFIRITRLKTAKYFRLLDSRLETCTLK